MATTMNRVWIEIEPTDDEELGKARCELVNRFLSRNGDSPFQFFYQGNRDHKGHYRKACYGYGGQMGSKDLVDHGEWFNLDYMGRATD